MVLISHDLSEIQNTYLLSLRAKLSGFRWISSLMRKLWNTAWGIWNFRNHTLHADYVPIKTEILFIINTRVLLHFNRGTSGLPKMCHFILKTNIHALLSRPVRKRFSWLAAASGAQQCSQRIPNRMGDLLDTDQLLLIRIHYCRIISYLTTFDQYTTFRTVVITEKLAVCLLQEKKIPCFTKILITTKT